MIPTDPLEAALREAFAMERATSEGNAWNANSIEFVVSRFLTNPVLATPRPAGVRCDWCGNLLTVTPRPAGDLPLRRWTAGKWTEDHDR